MPKVSFPRSSALRSAGLISVLAAVPQQGGNAGIFGCFFGLPDAHPGVLFYAGDRYGEDSNGKIKTDVSSPCTNIVNRTQRSRLVVYNCPGKKGGKAPPLVREAASEEPKPEAEQKPEQKPEPKPEPKKDDPPNGPAGNTASDSPPSPEAPAKPAKASAKEARAFKAPYAWRSIEELPEEALPSVMRKAVAHVMKATAKG